MSSPSPPSSSRPPPIQTTFSSPLSFSRHDRPRPPNHHHLSNPSSAQSTPRTSPNSARFKIGHNHHHSSNPSSSTASSHHQHPDPLLSRLTPTTITKMSDQDFLPGEKEVGVWAATAAEKIDYWLEEVESWEVLTYWVKTEGEGFRVPSSSGKKEKAGRKKRRKVDLEAAVKRSKEAATAGGGKLPVARRLFTEEAAAAAASQDGGKSKNNITSAPNATTAGNGTTTNGGIRLPSLKLDKKTKDAISMSQIDELLSPTATPLLTKRMDLDNFHHGHNGVLSSPMTPGRLWTPSNHGPLSPFSPFDKLPKRRSLQVSSGFGLGISTGSGTPTVLKRQTFDFTPVLHDNDVEGIIGGGRSLSGGSYRPSSSPTKSAPLEGNPFLGALPPTSNPMGPPPPPQFSPKLDPATDSETDLIHTSSSASSENEEDELEFLGSLTKKTLNYITTRITTISSDLSQLDIEGLKSRVLHFKSQQIDEHGNGRMSDSLAIITATTLQLLPPLHRLWFFVG
ncbi:hypothetical protein TWF281_008651 [Arthrobotrys megalospora]